MIKRVCIIGPSGTGKTTLAAYIAARHMIKFDNGSSSKLTVDRGLKSHADTIKLCSNDTEDAMVMYSTILQKRINILQQDDDFVTDRGLQDLLVYSTLQLSPHMKPLDAAKFEEDIEMAMIESTTRDIKYIFLPFNPGYYLENNGKRIINKTYQKLISNCFDTIIHKTLNPDNVLILNHQNWEDRVKAVDNLFKEPSRITRIKSWLKRITKRN